MNVINYLRFLIIIGNIWIICELSLCSPQKENWFSYGAENGYKNMIQYEKM